MGLLCVIYMGPLKETLSENAIVFFSLSSALSVPVSDLRIKLLKKWFFDCRHHSIQMRLKELKLLSQEHPNGNE